MAREYPFADFQLFPWSRQVSYCGDSTTKENQLATAGAETDEKVSFRGCSHVMREKNRAKGTQRVNIRSQ